MGIENMEYMRLLFGIFLFVLSGYLWSLLIFRKIRVTERIAIGFGFTMAVSVIVVMAFSLYMKVTASFFIEFFAVYTLIPAAVIATKKFIAIKKKGFSFSTKQFIPKKREMIKFLILVGILIFVFYMTFLPHSVKDYNLPFHADEWVHWGYTRGFMDSGELKFSNPFTGKGWAVDPEIGFHAFLACFKWLSGAELKTIFLLMPSALAIFTGLTAFSIGERSEKKFGLLAAFFIAFVPTSNRFLGPSFLVPLSLGLFLTLLALMIAQMGGYRKYPLLVFILFFTVLAHPPSAVAMTIVLLLYAISLIIERKYKEGAFIALMTVAPLSVAYLTISTYFERGISSLFGEKYASTLSMVDMGSYLGQLGYITMALFIFAFFMAIYKGKALQRSMSLAALSFISIIFLYDKYGFGLPIMYDRSFCYFFMFTAILAGYGLAWVKEYGEKAIKYAIKSGKILHDKRAVKIIGIAIPVLLCLTNAFFVVPVHREEPYYKVISEDNFDEFDWIRNNIYDYRDEYHSFDKASITPLRAVSFSAVTGVHTICSNFLPKYGTNIEREMNSFLADKGKDTDFMEKYGTEVVYGSCENKNLSEVYKNVYLYYGVPPKADFTFEGKDRDFEFTSTSTTHYGEIINWTWDFDNGDTSNGKINGLDFEEGNYVRAKMKMNESFSIEMQIKPNFSYDDGKNHEWFRWVGGGTYIVCYKHSNNRVYFIVRGEEWKAVSSVIEFDANTWHHFAATYNAWTGTFNLYWDGKIIESKGGGGKISSEEGTVIMGGVNDRWFDGCIKDARIYGRMMNGHEVEENYKDNVTVNGLQSWWKFDEGNGTIAKDNIGNNNATIYGAKWINYAEYAHSKSGEYTVTLTVMNDKGLTDSISKKITVS